ncbi:uncharacterized protein AB675_2796 [Cyphellophora attinorum]|uniref:Xylanolytic transcriptional activator regulatory domain-containing protein n=1 Tax=Cyphellophora attinorum TaxID=1664694 RepID=A0A0N1HH87_9EURO|nr:uncharacterized protein AB675_2796 [Phialophora attinorum]KPI45262.1 hypothetical protein AB675_2796 [Phialophora attinorum]
MYTTMKSSRHIVGALRRARTRFPHAISIKCDRKTPCNSCIASKVACRTTKRAPEKKQRVLLSSKYDEGLANVNKRLEDLQNALQSLLEGNKHGPGKDLAPTAQHHVSDSPAPGSKPDDSDVLYEGDSSFNAHSKHITETLGAALASTSVSEGSVSPSINHAAIRQLLSDVAAVQSPPQNAITTPKRLEDYRYTDLNTLKNLPLPSMSLVLKLLRIAQTTLQRWSIDYQVMEYNAFKTLCQRVYFPTSEYSIFDWILVNGGLFFLFRDAEGDLHEKLQIERSDVVANLNMCKNNVDTAIHGLPLCVEPSLEACQAIIIGASIAMEAAQGAHAWRLTSVASRMCLDLGLHRLRRDESPENLRARLCFWTVYAMDKGLAFNFGQTPTGNESDWSKSDLAFATFDDIHDYDLTIDRLTLPGDLEGPWGPLWLATLDFAILQGEIYEQLISISAQKEPEHVRIQRAREFAKRIDGLRQPVLAFGAEAEASMPNQDLTVYAVLSTDILIGCMNAIIYRVIPPPQPAHPLQYCEEAVQSSRSALENLQQAFQKIQADSKTSGVENWELFLNWTILFVPFVPFVVLFGNIIAQRSLHDLDLLRKTVKALESIADRSPAGRKLHGACAQFLKIAEMFLSLDSVKQPGSQPSPKAVVTDNVESQMLPEFPVSQQDWDGMLNDFDLGLGAESAREMMTSYFEPFMSGNYNNINY